MVDEPRSPDIVNWHDESEIMDTFDTMISS